MRRFSFSASDVSFDSRPWVCLVRLACMSLNCDFSVSSSSVEMSSSSLSSSNHFEYMFTNSSSSSCSSALASSSSSFEVRIACNTPPKSDVISVSTALEGYGWARQASRAISQRQELTLFCDRACLLAARLPAMRDCSTEK